MPDPDSDWSFRQVPTFETVAFVGWSNYHFETVAGSFSEEVYLSLNMKIPTPFSIPCKHPHMTDKSRCRHNIVKVYSKHYLEVRLKHFMDEYDIHILWWVGKSRLAGYLSNSVFCNFSRLAGEPFCNDGSKEMYAIPARWHLLVTPDLYWKNAEIIRQAIWTFGFVARRPHFF